MAKCNSCNTDARHIIIDRHGERCEFCGGVSLTSGSTDKVHSRNIFSIRQSSQEFEGDLITPWTVDKNSGQRIINQDFVDRFPDQAFNYYTEDELQKLGLTKLAEKAESDRAEAIGGQDEDDVEFDGEISEQDIQNIPDKRS